MKKIALLLILLVTVASVALIALRSGKEHQQQEDLYLSTSDAAKITRTVVIAGDDWPGYSVCRSPRFAQILAEQGIGVKFEMVFDFKTRVQGLATGEYQFAVITLDSYLAQGQEFNWPGVGPLDNRRISRRRCHRRPRKHQNPRRTRYGQRSLHHRITFGIPPQKPNLSLPARKPAKEPRLHGKGIRGRSLQCLQIRGS